MASLNAANVEKLLAVSRYGLDIGLPAVSNEIHEKGRRAFDLLEQLSVEESAANSNVSATCAWVVTDVPLLTVILYVEAERCEQGQARWGKFGVDVIPAEKIRLGDGREAQIPHLSVRILHDGWRSEIIRAPLGFLCSDWDLRERVVTYEHKYFPPIALTPDEISRENTNLVYVGVTRKNWAGRWRQHLQAARSGSHYDFHEAIRQFEGVYHSMHTVLSVTQDWDSALEYEEIFVRERSLRPKGLNMIPGGKAGLAFAAKYGALVRAKQWEQREIAVRQIQLGAKRLGLPNPAQSLRLSSDTDLMWRMVEARENTFSGNEIAIIRSLYARGMGWREIATALAVKDAYRVRDLVEGRTYRFVN